MRYIVISDIHGNFPALQTVLLDAQPFDAVLCLGDLIGYGPNPNECVERVQDFPLTCIVGNHDWGAIGRADLLIFNNDARQALYWTQHELSSENRNFIADLPTTVQMDDFLLVHGSPREPIWEYLVDVRSARENFMAHNFNIALVGHTHLPLALEWLEDNRQAKILLPDWEVPLPLTGRRLILNPGSVGQPRDGDPRASYAILDTAQMTWEFRRVAYAVEITQERMRARGLPQRLIDRLQFGR
ncbi:MAG TPA: metallophosphoesterase family protein [Anaerolineae bacterium]|nr:metallophosphoesterase family protein [Anaerolineae bacterium]HQK15601.1 metallophosphoesterase family protein [Anaerolineae bacterium]